MKAGCFWFRADHISRLEVGMDDLVKAVLAFHDERDWKQFHLVSLADAAGLDLLEAARGKLRQNALKYPVERARGTAKKEEI